MTNNTTPTLIQTPLGFDSTAAEVIDGIDLSGDRPIRRQRSPVETPS